MAWYNAAWLKRKKITIDNTKVSGASHTSFPVLISETDADIKASAQADGDDILFTSSDGTTKLDHEIERWNNGTGQLIAWVRIPTLSGSVDTDIYVYYGNPAASDQQNPTGVWDSNYMAVWHLNDDFLDSTSNNNDGTNQGSSDVAGRIADGQSLNGSSDYISIPDSASLDLTTALTIEAWMNISSNGNIVVRNTNGYIFGIYGPSGKLMLSKNGVDFIDGTTVLNTSQWYRGVVTRTGGTNYIYLDGGLENSGAGADFLALADSILIGRNQPSAAYYGGILDEIRISDIARSADWILTDFNSQNAPATFYSVGAEEEFGSTLNRISGVLDRTTSGVLVRVFTA